MKRRHFLGLLAILLAAYLLAWLAASTLNTGA